MHYSIQILAVFALLCTVALSSPIPHQQKKRSFKVSRIRQRDFAPDGTVALRKSYTKFGIAGYGFVPELDVSSDLIPFSELDAASGTGSGGGSVAASSSQNDAEFLSPVSVGGQTLVMNFDTGSSDM